MDARFEKSAARPNSGAPGCQVPTDAFVPIPAAALATWTSIAGSLFLRIGHDEDEARNAIEDWNGKLEPITRKGSMTVRTFAWSGFRERRMLPALALVACLAMTVSAMSQGQAGQLSRECALKETAVITLIDDHGAAEDLPAARLSEAGLTMLRARAVCYEGHVGEALAVYQSILDLGPVASLRRQRP
jgi:hypothetical protein